MQPLSASAVLAAWESGRDRHPVDRALLLLSLATPDADPTQLPDLPLGRRNRVLLELRQATFGERLRAYLDCPLCGERLELDLDAGELLGAVPLPPGHDAEVRVNGLRFRLPTSRDLARVAQESEVEAGALRLLGCCLLEEGAPGSTARASLASCIGEAEAALAEIDPWADLTLAFQCKSCGRYGTAPLEIAAFFWEEVEARAQGLLDEVHSLARAYGWSEAQILALSEARRGAYLRRVNP